MASSHSSVIQFDELQDAQSELQFEGFSHKDSSAATLETSEHYTSFPNSPDAIPENVDLLAEEREPSSSFWEFAYYQSFFDVDTSKVLQRIMGSVLPMPGRATYLDRLVRPTPDLYGPFWISTTLIFSTAISANIAEFLMTEGKDNKIWHYDFHKVSLSATAIYTYVFLLPLALWGMMWYRQGGVQYTLLEIICVYGYSLFIYVPLSILWLIQVSWLQWMLVFIGAALSGSVLVHTFWPTVRDGNRKIAVLVLCLILLFHTLLAVGFVAYFFRPPLKAVPSTVAPAFSVTTHIPSNSSENLLIKEQKASREAKTKTLVQDGKNIEKPSKGSSISNNSHNAEVTVLPKILNLVVNQKYGNKT